MKMYCDKKPPSLFTLQVNLADEFDILQIVGEGWFGKILLTEHRSTQTEMVLKALPKAYTSITDFYREFHYGLHLSAHRNIITTYDVAFETAGFYIFSQEYAPLGETNISQYFSSILINSKIYLSHDFSMYSLHIVSAPWVDALGRVDPNSQLFLGQNIFVN